MSTLPQADDPRWLLTTVFSRWRTTVPAAALMSVSFVCNAMTPVIVGSAIDDAVAAQSAAKLLRWLAVLAAVFTLNAAAAWFARGLVTRASLMIGHDLRMAVTDRIQQPRGMGGPRRTAGELLSIASSDTQRVADAVMMTVFPVAEVCSIAYVAVMMARVDLALGAAILLGAPVMVWVSLRAAVPLRRKSSARQAALARASATATDVVQGLRILKGLGAMTTVRRRYQEVSDEAYETTVVANGARAQLNAVTDALGAIYVVAVAIAAGALAAAGQMSIGELITVVGLTQFVITPMTMMGKNIASRWASAQASARRIVAILGAEAERREAAAPTGLGARPGLSVFSSLPPEGLEELPRERFLVVPHQADLFEGTVIQNVSADADRARRGLHAAAVEDIPGGVEREVGEYGGNLSGGQRQRVALARAVAAEPEVLILQDPTTAVDSVTEQVIAERVAAARADKPTVVFTSAPAWHALGEEVR